MAVVEGRLQIREWTDKEGNKRRTAEVVASNVYFADSKPNDGQSSGQKTAGKKDDDFGLPAGFQPSGDSFADLADDDGDLPF